MSARSARREMEDEEWDMESPIAKKELGRREKALYDLMHNDIRRDFPIISAQNDRFEVRSRGVLVGVHPTPEEAEEQVQSILARRKKIKRAGEQVSGGLTRAGQYAKTVALNTRERMEARRAARVSGLDEERSPKTKQTETLLAGAVAGALLYYVLSGDFQDTLDRKKIGRRLYGKEGPQDIRDRQAVEVALARRRTK